MSSAGAGAGSGSGSGAGRPSKRKRSEREADEGVVSGGGKQQRYGVCSCGYMLGIGRVLIRTTGGVVVSHVCVSVIKSRRR